MTARCCFRLYVQRLTRSAHPKEHFITVRAELSMLNAPGLKEDQTVHRLSLRIEKFIAREGTGAPTRDYLGTFPLREPSKQRGSAHQHQVFPKIRLHGEGIFGGGTRVAASGDISRHIIHQGKSLKEFRVPMMMRAGPLSRSRCETAPMTTTVP